MARSVGEAAANGLESGLNLGMAIVNQRRQQDRQDTLDAQHSEDRQRAIMRQQMADQGAALDTQLKDLNSEGAAMEASPTRPNQDQMQAFSQRVGAVKAARDAHYAKLSGVTVEDAHAGAKADQAALDAGDMGKVKNLTRALTVATERDPKDYIRPEDGGPSPIEQAGQDLMTGIQSGDKNKMLAGANVLFGPKLQQGRGQPSPHGGTIVRKEIVDLVPDPNSDPQKDPKYIPVLKVYVDRGEDFKGPRGQFGETGSYIAPLTQDRATGDAALVKGIGFKEVGDFAGHNLQIAEQLNTPEGLAKLKADADAGTFDPQQYLTALPKQEELKYQQALQRAGVQPAKNVVTRTVMQAGSSVLEETTNSRTGEVTKSKVIQGNAKINTADKLTIFSDGIDKQVEQGVMSEEEGAKLKADFARRQASGSGDAALSDKLDRIENDPNLSDAQKAEQKKALLSGIKPAGLKAGAVSATDKANMAVMGRRLQVLKDQRLSLENDRKTALEEFKLASHDGNNKKIAAAKAIYDTRVAALEGKGKDLETRISKISDELDNREVKAAKAEDGEPAPAPKGGGGPPETKIAPATQAARDKDALKIQQDERARIVDSLAKMTNPDAIAQKKGDLAAIDREIALTTKRAGGLASAKGSNVAPLPSTKDGLKANVIYQTKRGPAKWNGSAFEAVQ